MSNRSETPEPTDAARRRAVLAAAERLLKHYGFAKTTVADIAREAGVSVGAVYLAFESKEALAAALSRRCHDEVLEALRGCAVRPASHAERVKALFEERARRLASLRQAGQHGVELYACACDAVRRVHAEAHAEQAAVLASLLREGTSAGELDVADPERVARVLITAHEAFGDGADDERAADRRAFEELAVRAVRAARPGR
ncbi:MAG: helix-turn-helix transcriptional regulator [Polyangiaceae bacterium]|nr:helix-turn-helix transcriptional regulator [Polyangiaceae bacterium]